MKTKDIIEIFERINLNSYSLLGEVMTSFGSDKGNGHHNYTILYEYLFYHFYNSNNLINIFELGLGTNNTNFKSNMGVNGKPGASLRGWKEYFKNAKIYGADIDKNILFEEKNIKTFFCDQTNVESIKTLWENPKLKNTKFHIIIDDGLHEFDANICFLENSFDKLEESGVYIIEDVGYNNIPKFISYLNNNSRYNFWNLLTIPNKNNNNDNNLIVLYKNEEDFK